MPHRTLLFAARLACCLAVLAACGPSQKPITTHEPAGAALINPHAVQINLTPPPAPPAPRVVKPRPRVEPGLVSLQPCGGDLPPCWVKQRESHGDYRAYNPTGCNRRGCGGAWQFDPRTWNGFGGYAEAQDAPPDVQDAKAREVWDGGRGCSHWAACG